MRVDVVTIFPRMFEAPLGEGIVRRALDSGLAAVAVHDLRQWSDDRHRSVDDAPFGGGPGMVMKAEPFARALRSLLPEGPGPRDAVVLLSPRGRRFDQDCARRYAGLARLVLLCGRYEGVDERVGRRLATEELSLGDFVLTGGEVAALAVIEAALRLLPGALGDAESAARDSFSDGLLGWPQYTRPASLDGDAVPAVLLSGDHRRVEAWRRREALRTTLERRPDLLERAALAPSDRALLREIEDEMRDAPAAAAVPEALMGK